MDGSDTIELVRKAKAGDVEATAQLCRQVFDRFVEELRGDLGQALRRQYDTVDIVQSAIAEILKNIGSLRNEAAFFAWAKTICRHKMARKRKKLQRQEALTPGGEEDLPGKDLAVEALLEKEEDLERLYEALGELFLTDPEEMGALYGQYWERKSIEVLAKEYGTSQRTIHRRLEDARRRLQERLRRS
ncbi:MAG: sigma-70 family RNA polymerase sigma factor [Planctomycetes bacterium]|nr:sigma-70 family RNA polymerase sigma factor [Planctomycetota bacterium]